MLTKKPFPREIVPLYIIKLIKACSHVTQGNSAFSWSQIIFTLFLHRLSLRTQLQISIISFVGEFMQLFTAYLLLILVFFINESQKH